MASFTAIPAVPSSTNPTQYYGVLAALKENVEMLTGTRGGAAILNKAIIRGNVTMRVVETTFRGVTATGAGVAVGGQQVPAYSDYVNLISDVDTLAQDVATLRNAINQLISQLRG